MNLDDPHLDRFEHPHRLNALCGYGLLLLGLAAVSAAALGIHDRGQWDDPYELRTAGLVLGLLAVVLVVGAGLLITLRSTVEVDEARGTLAVVKSALGFVRRVERPLDDRGRVVLDARKVMSGDTDVTMWFVTYVHPEGSLELHRLQEEPQGRAWAERFARRLSAPFIDATCATPDVRRQDELDVSAVERGDWRGSRWPRAQVSERVRYARDEALGALVEVAPPGFSGVTLNGLLLLSVAAWVGVACTRSALAQSSIAALLFLPFVLAVVGVLAFLGGALVHATLWNHTRARVDDHGITFLQRDGRDTLTLAASDIERVAPNRDGTSLSLVTDAGTTPLGSSLSEEEVSALQAIVLLGLAGPDAR